jgi:peptidoglycan/xylan/chitin deacetylase (PgdA/CDA1 family)
MASLAGAAGVLAWAVRGRSSTLLAPSHWEGTRTRPSIALTFDDGPSESTPDLLEVLDRWNIRATFFQCGTNVKRLPAIARMVAEAGHEIGNHSETHPRFDFRSRKFIFNELQTAQKTFQEYVGVTPRLYRPPFGIRWFGMAAAQKKLGLTSIMWSCIGLDWRLGSTAIAARCTQSVRSGAIYCLHDGRELQVRPNVRPSIEATKKLIPELLDRGYEFETTSELLSDIPPSHSALPAV